MKKWPEKGVDSLDGENLVVFCYLSTSKIWPRNRGLLYKTIFENKSLLCDIVISGINIAEEKEGGLLYSILNLYMKKWP
jgi:hypothetical protein